jgi:hypothetical protein
MAEALQKLPTISSPNLSPRRMRPSDLVAHIKRFLGLWPSARADNPDVYIAGVCATLEAYPDSTALAAMDPVHGIAAQSKFLPTLAELHAWCEARERIKLISFVSLDREQTAWVHMLDRRYAHLAKRYQRERGKTPFLCGRGDLGFRRIGFSGTRRKRRPLMRIHTSWRSPVTPRCEAPLMQDRITHSRRRAARRTWTPSRQNLPKIPVVRDCLRKPKEASTYD